jgi:uncharacterized protein DUF6526
MAQQTTQSFSKHGRYDPLFHFFAIPVFVITWIISAGFAIRHPSFVHIWIVVFNTALLVVTFRVRMYALKAQDRVIRLEERLRLAQLLPESQRRQISDLSEGQLIALRFASDAELPGLVQQAVTAHLSATDIKKAIKEWRPDYFRI